MHKSPLFWFLLTLLAIVLLTAIGPAEKTLGASVRVVYLHGAWVWAAIIGFVAAALVGLAGLVSRRRELNYWSRALGRTGLFFWITYLPISMWAMQTNWNGLFLAEPRWRVGLIFAIGGLALQVGVSLLEDPIWASVSNIIFAIMLFISLQSTEQVMHPASPIFGSDAWRIQVFFLALIALTLLAAWQLARWWRSRDRAIEPLTQ
jgi:uncharacterized integral membrane protein